MLALGDLFIGNIQTHPQYFFAVVITVVVSIVLHELAHGWVAIRLGDDTPAATGHMTLNPFVHMGIFSLLLLFTMGIAFGAMPVNRTRLRGKYAEALVALAGPAVNLILGVLGTIGFALLTRFGTDATGHSSNLAVQNGLLLLQVMGVMNFALLIFNLIPFPPLDGSYVVANVLPVYRRLLSNEVAKGAMLAIFFALFLGGGTFIFMAALRMFVFVARPFAS